MILVLLNLLTPLRLNTDGIRYLNIVEYLNGALGENSYAAHDFFPHGYPRFLQLLSKLNLLNGAVLTLINVISTLAAAYLLTLILPVKNKLLFLSIVMLSFLNVKQFTLPIADQLFTLIFTVGIYLWIRFFNGRWYWIIPALLVTILAIYVRTAGIALMLGVIMCIVFHKRKSLLKSKPLVYCIGLVIIVAVALFLFNLVLIAKHVDYIRQLELLKMVNEPASIIDRLFLHFKELGELLINLPYSKIASITHINVVVISALAIALGVIVMMVIVLSIRQLKLYNNLIFWVGLVYLAMIFVWPFYDTRFFTPVVPVLIYLVIHYLSSLKTNYLRVALFISYITFGLISLLYSDALSLSRPYFLKHYGFDAGLTNAYRIHFGNKDNKRKPVYDINKDNYLYLLQLYDK